LRYGGAVLAEKWCRISDSESHDRAQKGYHGSRWSDWYN